MLQRLTVSEDRLRSETVDEPEFLQCWSPRHWQILFWLNITVLWYVIKKMTKTSSSYGVQHGYIPSCFVACTNCTYWWSVFKTLLLLTTRPAACYRSLSLPRLYNFYLCNVLLIREVCIHLCMCALISLSVFVSFCMCLWSYLSMCVFIFISTFFCVCTPCTHTTLYTCSEAPRLVH